MADALPVCSVCPAASMRSIPRIALVLKLNQKPEALFLLITMPGSGSAVLTYTARGLVSADVHITSGGIFGFIVFVCVICVCTVLCDCVIDLPYAISCRWWNGGMPTAVLPWQQR